MPQVKEKLRRGRIAAIAIGVLAGTVITGWIDMLKFYVTPYVEPAVNWVGMHISRTYVETASRPTDWRALVLVSGIAVVALAALWVGTLWVYGGEDSPREASQEG